MEILFQRLLLLASSLSQCGRGITLLLLRSSSLARFEMRDRRRCTAGPLSNNLSYHYTPPMMPYFDKSVSNVVVPVV